MGAAAAAAPAPTAVDTAAAADELPMALPDDVLREHLMPLLEPRDVCRAGAASRVAAAWTAPRRAALALARRALLSRARVAAERTRLRDAWAAAACGVPALDGREASSAALADALLRSPDGLRDLAAATQRALSAVVAQDHVPPSALAAVRFDLLRVANFVCIAAWRGASRARRRAEREQQQQQQPHQQQPQQQGAPAAAVASQTEGATLGEARELVAGLLQLLQSANPSVRACAATLCLLQHHVAAQLRAWQPPPGGAGADEEEDEEEEEDDGDDAGE